MKYEWKLNFFFQKDTLKIYIFQQLKVTIHKMFNFLFILNAISATLLPNKLTFWDLYCCLHVLSEISYFPLMKS